MKKILSLLLACCLLFSGVTACKRDPEPAASSSVVSSVPEPASRYHDGEYQVSYLVPALDRTLDYLTVNIENDEVQIVDYGMKEETTSDTASSADASSAVPAASSSTSSEVSTAEMDGVKIAEEILAEYEAVRKQIDKIEPLAGQEEHTYRFMRMMRTALRFAEAGDQKPVSLGKYADGDYKAEMPSFNENGWKEFVELTVKDGLITDLQFDAAHKDDATRRITTDTTANSAENKPSTYYPEIAKDFLDAGDNLSLMMTPTGGAAATKSFQKLMDALLVSMVSEGERSITAPRYVNGTYRAEFTEFDKNGWKDYLVVRIDQDRVAIKEFDAISKADETLLKSADSKMSAAQEEKTGTTPAKALEELKQNWETAKNDVTTVDNVAGATVSSNNFKLLLGQILATAALEGDSENTLKVARIETKIDTKS